MSVDADVWTCPDCPETVRGTPQQRAAAQREHADRHRADRAVQDARRQQEADDRLAALDARRHRQHTRKQATRAGTRRAQ